MVVSRWIARVGHFSPLSKVSLLTLSKVREVLVRCLRSQGFRAPSRCNSSKLYMIPLHNITEAFVATNTSHALRGPIDTLREVRAPSIFDQRKVPFSGAQTQPQYQSEESENLV